MCTRVALVIASIVGIAGPSVADEAKPPPGITKPQIKAVHDVRARFDRLATALRAAKTSCKQAAAVIANDDAEEGERLFSVMEKSGIDDKDPRNQAWLDDALIRPMDQMMRAARAANDACKGQDAFELAVTKNRMFRGMLTQPIADKRPASAPPRSLSKQDIALAAQGAEAYRKLMHALDATELDCAKATKVVKAHTTRMTKKLVAVRDRLRASGDAQLWFHETHGDTYLEATFKGRITIQTCAKNDRFFAAAKAHAALRPLVEAARKPAR
jgi:hypothetical protein